MTWADLVQDWDYHVGALQQALPLLDINDLQLAGIDRGKLVDRLVFRGMERDAAEIALGRFEDRAQPRPRRKTPVSSAEVKVEAATEPVAAGATAQAVKKS